MGSFLTFLFGFYFDLGLNGVWLAKTCMTYFLIGYYLVILYRLDWFEIVLEAHKRQAKKDDMISNRLSVLSPYST